MPDNPIRARPETGSCHHFNTNRDNYLSFLGTYACSKPSVPIDLSGYKNLVDVVFGLSRQFLRKYLVLFLKKHYRKSYKRFVATCGKVGMEL